MAGTMRRMMEYLSFAEPQDEEYEEYVDETRSARTAAEDEERRGASRVESIGTSERFVSEPAGTERAEPRPLRVERGDRSERSDLLERADRFERTDQPARRSAATHADVTPINAHLGHELRRIVTVHPSTYNEARTIGEAFREGTPVIVNLTDMGEADAKRMVDFSAGLVFGLHGTIERVTSRVFLLSPATVEVESDGDSRDARVFHQS